MVPPSAPPEAIALQLHRAPLRVHFSQILPRLRHRLVSCLLFRLSSPRASSGSALPPAIPRPSATPAPPQPSGTLVPPQVSKSPSQSPKSAVLLWSISSLPGTLPIICVFLHRPHGVEFDTMASPSFYSALGRHMLCFGLFCSVPVLPVFPLPVCFHGNTLSLHMFLSYVNHLMSI